MGSDCEDQKPPQGGPDRHRDRRPDRVSRRGPSGDHPVRTRGPASNLRPKIPHMSSPERPCHPVQYLQSPEVSCEGEDKQEPHRGRAAAHPRIHPQHTSPRAVPLRGAEAARHGSGAARKRLVPRSPRPSQYSWHLPSTSHLGLGASCPS